MTILKYSFLDANGTPIEGLVRPSNQSEGDDDAETGDELAADEAPSEAFAAVRPDAGPITADELDALEQLVADALRPLLVTIDTRPIDDDALAHAAEALAVLADGITSGYFRPEISGAAFVQLNPYRPIPFAEIYDYMDRHGRAHEAASIRDAIGQAAALLRLSILPPSFFRPS